jgi:hypothetical protein
MWGRHKSRSRCAKVSVPVLTAVALLGIFVQGGCRDESPGGDGDAGVGDAGASGCWVPPVPTIIDDNGLMGEVYGLDVLPDGRYLLGALTIVGPVFGERSGLLVLDGDTLQEVSFLDMAGQVYGRYDVYGDAILAARRGSDEVTLAWLSYGADGGLEMLDATRLCTECRVSESLPALGDPQGQTPLGLAVVVEHRNPPEPSEVELFVVDRGVMGVARSIDRVAGEHPSVAAGHWGYVLTYTAPSGHLATRVVDHAGTLVGSYELDPVPVNGRASVTVRVTDEQIDAVLMDTAGAWGEPPAFSAVALSVDGVVIRQWWYNEVSTGAEDYWLSATQELLLATWADTSQEDMSGAWLLLLTARYFHRVCGPLRVGGESSAMVHVVSAPHPAGFVVIWSGEENGIPGVYGTIVSATP